MDISRLHPIIHDCLAKDEIDPDNVPDGIKLVDVGFFLVALDVAKAESHRDELIALLDTWPTTAFGQDIPTLTAGPSYMDAGAVVGDQQAALVLFAIGEVLGFWKVVTPAFLGFEGQEAAELAGLGMILIDGYHPEPSRT